MITDLDLGSEEIEKIDSELKEVIGVEVSHEPYLADRFRNLFMEDSPA
jgi:hypothetical protein